MPLPLQKCVSHRIGSQKKTDEVRRLGGLRPLRPPIRNLMELSGASAGPAPLQHGRTRAGSKLPAGPQRGAAHHRQPQKGAERAGAAPTVRSRLHFFPCLG